MTTWMITGASSGLGRALAELVLGSGDHVIAAVRDTASVADLAETHPDTLAAVRLDLTDEPSIRDAVAEAESRSGRIDVLVNNAGYGYYAAVEEAEAEAVDRLFATNFFGPVALLRAALPGMRRHGSGLIINVSSAGARSPAASGGHYAATKAALEAVSGSLRHEVAPFGVRVMVVEPGTFRTDFRGRSADRARTTIAAYDAVIGERGGADLPPQLGDPAKAAAAVVAAVRLEDPPRLLVLGSDALAAHRAATAQQTQDVDRLEHLSLSTDAESTGGPDGSS